MKKTLFTTSPYEYMSVHACDQKPTQASDSTMETASTKASRNSWARLIKKVYEVDPLCMSEMWERNESYMDEIRYSLFCIKIVGLKVYPAS